MNSERPVRRPGIVAQDMGRETLLYSAEGKAIHVLNPTAQCIWELCDGEHSAEDMERALRASFSIAAEHDVSGDVQRTLEVFAAKGLLQEE